jgi:hypothetical protein
MEVADRSLWRLAELPARSFRTFVGGRQDRNVAKLRSEQRRSACAMNQELLNT